MLFYIKSKLSISIPGISGVSQEGASSILHANSDKEAKAKFEHYWKLKKQHMEYSNIHFEYLEVAAEINL